MTLNHPALDMPICVPFTSAEDLSGENIMAEIERVIQSNHVFNIADGDMA